MGRGNMEFIKSLNQTKPVHSILQCSLSNGSTSCTRTLWQTDKFFLREYQNKTIKATKRDTTFYFIDFSKLVVRSTNKVFRSNKSWSVQSHLIYFFHIIFHSPGICKKK